MTCLSLTLALLVALAGEPGPTELVGLLGSADCAERDEAERTLEELGADALPALRDARDAGPPEVRARVSGLLERIEGQALTLPTRVALDFDGQPLAEVVRTLTDRTGFAMALDAGDDRELPARPIAVRAPGPVPFWEALDRIGRAGQVRHNPGAKVAPDARPVVLYLADGEPPAFTLYRGAIRVHLLAVDRLRDRTLMRAPGIKPSSSETMYVEIQAFAEPGRFLDPDGLPRLEATDDQGRLLPPPPVNADWPKPTPTGGWVSPGVISMHQWRLPLGVPAADVASLRRLRGALSLVISAHRADSLVVPLADASDKTFHLGGTSLRFGTIPEQAKGGLQFDLFIRRADGPEADHGPGTSGPRPIPGPVLIRNQIEIEDAEGRPLSWLPLMSNRQDGSDLRVRLMLSRSDRGARLRYFDLTRTATEVPFEFADVPLP